jgi:broad specificity phosphatase PhoE
LQTIRPYVADTNKKIGIDYGLYEFRTNSKFRKDPQVYTINDVSEASLLENIDYSYISSLQPSDLVLKKDDFGNTLLEKPEELQNRVKVFLNKVLNEKEYDGKTLLLVSHKTTLNMIRSLLQNPSLRVTDESFNREPFPFSHYVVYRIGTK